MPADPMPAGEQPTETCPGCGAVLAPAPPVESRHPGASASCARLFEVTLRGLREESAEPGVAAVVRLADEAYDRQHGLDDDPAGEGTRRRPRVWRTTIADVAADLDVIDLPVLVASWARSVHEDLAAPAARQ